MLMVSIIMIIVGILNKGNVVGDISLNIGISIISTVLVYLFLKFLADDPLQPVIDKIESLSSELSKSVDLLKDGRETGVLRICNNRSELSLKEWIARIEKSKGDIRILCYAMAFLIDDSRFDDVIKRKIEEGKKVEVLLGKPGGKCIQERTLEEKNEGNIDERINRTFCRLRKIKNEVADENSIVVKYHDTPLYASIYIFGENMIVTPQLYGERGAGAPILEVVKTENRECLYNKYYNMVENIWKNQAEVDDWKKE